MKIQNSWRTLLSVCVVGLMLLAVFRISQAARTGAGPLTEQDAIRLESRISQLEQRLYSIENNVRTLEQQSRLASSTPRGGSVTPEDLAVLRSAIQTLQLRLEDDECSLARLDERTLTPVAREARRRSAGADPCRENAGTPLRLPDRRQ